MNKKSKKEIPCNSGENLSLPMLPLFLMKPIPPLTPEDKKKIKESWFSGRWLIMDDLKITSLTENEDFALAE